MASVKYLPVLPWVLPLALSFYGFQSLTYTIDIYRRDAQPAESYLAYLASASFFPTTVAGPITRLSDVCAAVVQARNAQRGRTAARRCS